MLVYLLTCSQRSLLEGLKSRPNFDRVPPVLPFKFLVWSEVLVPGKNPGLAIRFGEEVCIDMQRQAGRLFRWQERVEQPLSERLWSDS